MTVKLRTGVATATWVVLLAGALSGCSAVRPNSTPDSESRLGPEPWSAAEVRGHLEVLEALGRSGRLTGSVAYVQAASHVESRLKEYGLQPVTQGGYRHLYFTPLHGATDARIVRFGRDTLVVDRGGDLLPDPRSSAGSVRARAVDIVRAGAPLPADPAPVVVSPASPVPIDRLQAWYARGVRAVLELRDPRPARSAQPVDGMLIVQVAPDRAERLLDGGPAWSLGGRHAIDLRVEVAASFEPAAAAMNILGYAVGRDPYRSDDLVIIGTALDRPGRSPAATAADADAADVAVAAVLESARVLSRLADQGRGPDRTVLFALWAGGGQDASGARAWVANPSWPLDAVRAVIDVRPDGHGAAWWVRTEPVVIDVQTFGGQPGGVEASPVDRARHLAHAVMEAASDAIWPGEGILRVPPLDVQTELAPQ